MRTYAPLPADHPLITDGEVCAACKVPFKEGDVTTLVPIGPGDDEEQRAKAAAGRAYNAVAVAAHAACADPLEIR